MRAIAAAKVQGRDAPAGLHRCANVVQRRSVKLVLPLTGDVHAVAVISRLEAVTILIEWFRCHCLWIPLGSLPDDEFRNSLKCVTHSCFQHQTLPYDLMTTSFALPIASNYMPVMASSLAQSLPGEKFLGPLHNMSGKSTNRELTFGCRFPEDAPPLVEA